MEESIDITIISKTKIVKKTKQIKPPPEPESNKLTKNMVRDVDLVCYDCPNLYIKASGRMNGVPYEQCECKLMESPVRPSFYSWEWMWDCASHDMKKPFDMLINYNCPNIQKFKELMTAIRIPPKYKR